MSPIFSQTTLVSLFCVMSISAAAHSMSVPKHFLQGKLWREDLIRQANQESPTDRPKTHRLRPKDHNSKQAIIRLEPPNFRFNSPDSVPRPVSRPLFKNFAGNKAVRDLCNSRFQCVAYSLRRSEPEGEKTKMRILRQGGIGLRPPAKIRVVISGLGREVEVPIDKSPYMDVAGALRTAGYTEEARNPGGVNPFQVTAVQEGDCLRITSVGGLNNLVDAQWILTVRDNNQNVRYSGFCFQDKLRLNPGYEIHLTNRPAL